MLHINILPVYELSFSWNRTLIDKCQFYFASFTVFKNILQVPSNLLLSDNVMEHVPQSLASYLCVYLFFAVLYVILLAPYLSCVLMLSAILCCAMVCYFFQVLFHCKICFKNTVWLMYEFPEMLNAFKKFAFCPRASSIRFTHSLIWAMGMLH